MIKENSAEDDDEQSRYIAGQQKQINVGTGGASKLLKPTMIDMKVVVTNNRTPLKAGVGDDEGGRQAESPEQLENMSIEQLCSEVNKLVLTTSQS